MKRRTFLSAIVGIPIVGRFWPKKKKYENWVKCKSCQKTLRIYEGAEKFHSNTLWTECRECWIKNKEKSNV